MNRDPPPPQPPSHTSTAGTSVAAIAANGCTNCCSDDRWILHYVRIRNLYRKLCTSCVLKLHPTSFCPICYNLHDPNSLTTIPNPNSTTTTTTITNPKIIKCFKCSSFSHTSCLAPNGPKTPYLCPPCFNPNLKFFDIKKPKKTESLNGDQNDGDRKKQVIDERGSKELLLAAKISSMSMNRAVVVARAEVEKKVKEAALARKRAKEAIDYVTSLSNRIQAVGAKRREVAEVAVAGVAAGVGAPPPVSSAVTGLKSGQVMPVKLETKNGVGKVNANANANGGGGVKIENKNGPVEVTGAGSMAPPPVVGATSVPPHLQNKTNNGISNISNSTNNSNMNNVGGGGGGGGGKEGTGAAAAAAAAAAACK